MAEGGYSVVQLRAGHRVRELFDGRRDAVVQSWAAYAGDSLRGRVALSELEQVFSELLDLLVPDSPVHRGPGPGGEGDAGARGLLGELSHDWARRGFSPMETAEAVFCLKRVLFALLDGRADPAADAVAVSRWVDELGLVTVDVFTRAREQIISEQAEQLLELTTPVVKLWDGVLAVPLIGTLDSARTQIVTEKLLQTLVDTGSEHAIIDITGVPAVDTEVAQHLLRTAVAARLMGAQCTISGIRPQIAQTIVALGIEFGDIPTKATLADALLGAMRASGADVVRRNRSVG